MLGGGQPRPLSESEMPSEPRMAAALLTWPCSSGHCCLPYRSGWFPEAYVKPLEEMPVNPMKPVTPMNSMAPMSPMNELPSRYLSWWGGTPRIFLSLPPGEIYEIIYLMGLSSLASGELWPRFPTS